MNKLIDLIAKSTVPYRKGAEISEEHAGQLIVNHVYFMPHVDEAKTSLVDVHFFKVGLAPGVDADDLRAQLIEALDEYPQPERLAGGPSYIESGAELGSQQYALQLYGLGELLGLWDVITPEKMHVTGPQADELAGAGFVMMTGYRKGGAR